MIQNVTCVILDFEKIGMDRGCQIKLPFVWSSYTLPDLVCPPQWVPVPKVFCPSAGSRRPWSGEGCSRWAQSRQHCSWKNKFKEKLIKNKKEQFYFLYSQKIYFWISLSAIWPYHDTNSWWWATRKTFLNQQISNRICRIRVKIFIEFLINIHFQFKCWQPLQISSLVKEKDWK